MINEYPLISVLMTAYNRQKYIALAIGSVLASTYKNFELIIVDDGSTDETVEIAQSFAARDHRIKVYVNEKNIGDYPNRNRAASYAKGKYITYLDSDDLIYCHGLEKMNDAAQRFPGAGLYMLTRDIDPPISDIIYLEPEESIKIHFEENGFLETGPLCTLIDYSCFNRIGGFSGKRMVGDTELWLKFATLFPIVKIEKHLGFWRKHEHQETTSGEYYYLVNMIQVYKEVLYNSNFPLPEKKKQYLYLIARPRILKIVKLAVKNQDVGKLRLLIDVLKIVIER